MPKREWLDSDWKMLTRLNSISVTKQDLLKLVDESLSIPDEQDEPGSRLFLIISRFYGNPEKGQAVYFRVEALIHLLKGEGVSGWALPPTRGGAVPPKRPFWPPLPLSLSSG